MRQVLAKGLLAAAATTGVLGVTGGTAFADAGASGESANSPGVLSGNNVHAPVEVPANICGNSADVVGALNPSFGNGCASDGGGAGHQAQGGQEQRSAEDAGQDAGEGAGEGAGAAGSAQNSPGVGSGNDAKAPVDVPVNACGNTADIVGLLNPVFGNHCAGSSNEQEHADESVPQHVTPDAPRQAAPEERRAGKANDPGSLGTQLAHTGTQQIGVAAGTGAALVLGGAILYRRARPGRR
ncbi:chaplin [Streptomyces ochraceiscleroticus]|uniref:Chaplin n=1 Tax=Streptomyces ochraceiscleroticus TaxID=47761 RepID=A0ABW1MP35_9ACTN|nr:chaplin [Streptomyces ochraceiscleroticus]